MKFEQDWKPDYPYCSLCGAKGVSPCSRTCSDKLDSLRYTIDIQIETEREMGCQRVWDKKQIKAYNELQEKL